MDYVEFLELRHSDDELMHRSHKYIKKYKGPSGKWVYVYADSKTHSEINWTKNQAAIDKRKFGYQKELYQVYVAPDSNRRKVKADIYSNNGRVNSRVAKNSAADADLVRVTRNFEREAGYKSAGSQIKYNDLLTQNSVRTKLNKAKSFVSNLFKKKR